MIEQIRDNIENFVKEAGAPPPKILDIAPDEWAVVQRYFENVKTLNIIPGCDITADITRCPELASNSWDVIFCLEILEHVYDPFSAASELLRLLVPGGLLYISTPFYFEVHGPDPDCYRFTEAGLRYMFREAEIVEFKSIGAMPIPIHHTMVVRKINKDVSQECSHPTTLDD